MIVDLLVYLALVVAAGFVLAAVISPSVRARIEAPKHLFVERVRRYDRGHHD